MSKRGVKLSFGVPVSLSLFQQHLDAGFESIENLNKTINEQNGTNAIVTKDDITVVVDDHFIRMTHVAE